MSNMSNRTKPSDHVHVLWPGVTGRTAVTRIQLQAWASAVQQRHPSHKSIENKNHVYKHIHVIVLYRLHPGSKKSPCPAQLSYTSIPRRPGHPVTETESNKKSAMRKWVQVH